MIFRIISIILDSVIVYNHNLIWLPIGGLLFHLCATWECLMKKKNYNMLLTVLWFCIILLISIKNLMIPQIFWLTVEHIIQYRMVSYMDTIILIFKIKIN